ncbi:hypothetical protein BLOT_011505 [Blomia tropicalis]|nr:hypothetical protein BLOT_011505 [Blomia tropicalis]
MSQFKAMFDLIGKTTGSLSENLRQYLSGSSTSLSNTKTDHSKITKNKSMNRINGVARSNSRNSIQKRHSLEGRSKRSKTRQKQSKRSQTRSKTSVASNTNQNVFAPRLLQFSSSSSTSSSLEKQNDLTIELMGKNHNHCAVYYIYCPIHKRVAMTKPTNKQALWMPFTPIPDNRSLQDAGLAGLLIILSDANMDTFIRLMNNVPFSIMHLIEITDIQLPQTQEIVSRIQWFVRLDQAAMQTTRFKCCKQTDSLLWLDEENLTTQTDALEYLWGLEPLSIHRMISKMGEHQFKGSNFVECNLEMAFQYLPRKPPANNEEQMLINTNMTEMDIERLYYDFLDHCFPCTSMTFHSFKVYMTKLQISYNDIRLDHLFRAFNYQNNGHISFPEFLMGLVCIDKSSQHNETRAKFIIRYYDVYKTGHLSEDDIRIIVQDSDKISPSNNDYEKMDQILNELNMSVDPVTGKRRITHRKFLMAIGGHQFRGTSKLCRLRGSILSVIMNANLRRSTAINNNKNVIQKLNYAYANVLDRPYNGICIKCKAKSTFLDDQLFYLNNDGYVINMDHHPELMKKNDNGSQTSLNQMKYRSFNESITSNRNRSSKTKLRVNEVLPANEDVSIQEMSSILFDNNNPIGTSDTFNNERLANIARNLLQQIREFSASKGDTIQPKGFLSDMNERPIFFEQLEQLTNWIVPNLKAGHCVAVSSPAYVIGDIHGNLSDLLSLEMCLWRRIPIVDANMIFLGDMVDRGKWSVECVTYLICLKVLMPLKVTLLRGNHEVRKLQHHYTYRNECLSKYGEDYGIRIWNLTNKIFDSLPLCAVIDRKVYCAHGGIPKDKLDLREIDSLPTIIENPEDGPLSAWEILWSDPLPQERFAELAHFTNIDITNCQGYLFNKKRGTAWFFNEDALDRFLSINELSHIVRAHEVPNNGFFFHFSKKCATIFSCSHYCGNNNECAVLFIERDVIRVVRIDTVNNKPATE